MSQESIVLMACGSYSPPTPMHFRMFEIAKDHFESLGSHNVVGGIVSPVHDAYGKKDLAAASHRLAMLKLVLKSSNWIKLSDWEVNQEGWSRTAQSLQFHQNFINAVLNDRINNDALDGTVPSWLPNIVLNKLTGNEDDVDNGNFAYINNNGNIVSERRNRNGHVRVKLLCGADLLESFAKPGLWSDEDLEQILSEHGLVVISRSGSNPEKFIYDSDVLTRFKKNITIVTNWVPNEVSSTMIRRLLRRGESVKYLIEDHLIYYIKQNQLYGTTLENNKLLFNLASVKPSTITPSPSPHDVVMESPAALTQHKEETKSRSVNISSKIINYLIGVDETDSNDVYTNYNHFKEKRLRLTNKVSSTADLPTKQFCSDPNDRFLENTIDESRKSVKVITDLSGVHKIVGGKNKVRDQCQTNEIYLCCNGHPGTAARKHSIDADKLSMVIGKLDIRDLNVEDVKGVVDNCGKSSPLRSYDDVVQFIFSEHGIQVLSDKETIV